MTDSLVKVFSQRSAFASRRHARALATCLPRKDHVYNTTVESFHFHHDKFDEMPCILYSTEILGSFEKYPSPPQTLAFLSCVFDVIFVICKSILTVQLLAGSESTISEITWCKFFRLRKPSREFKYRSEYNIVPLGLIFGLITFFRNTIFTFY